MYHTYRKLLFQLTPYHVKLKMFVYWRYFALRLFGKYQYFLSFTFLLAHCSEWGRCSWQRYASFVVKATRSKIFVEPRMSWQHLDLQEFVIIAKLNKSNFSLPVELISWSSLPNAADTNFFFETYLVNRDYSTNVLLRILAFISPSKMGNTRQLSPLFPWALLGSLKIFKIHASNISPVLNKNDVIFLFLSGKKTQLW